MEITQQGIHIELGPVNVGLSIPPPGSTQPSTALGEEVSLMSHTVTYCHKRVFPFCTQLWVAPPRIKLYKDSYISVPTATSVLSPCWPFHTIHLQAVFQTGVIPGYSREVQMVRTSQQQTSGPECSAVPAKPRTHSQRHMAQSKQLVDERLPTNPFLPGKW